VKWFDRRRKPLAPSLGEAGRRVYAVGDVHGRLDLLIRLLEAIGIDTHSRPIPQWEIIFLGDVIDRGPDTRMIIRTLRGLENDAIIVLKGNHEDSLVRAYHGDLDALNAWLSFGGIETLRSYAVRPEEIEALEEEDLLGVLRANIPRGDVDWLDSLPVYQSRGDYLFCHAGIRPDRPLTAQTEDDMLWIREPFLSSRRWHGAMVVHGHSIAGERAEHLPNRIGVDSGAYRTGVLTAAVFEEQTVREINVRPGLIDARVIKA
jgi:serine/threonine protein phosphatase 1